MTASIPHLRVVIGFCIAALVGYSVFSGYVVFNLKDPALTGDVIGTWKSFAVGVFAFWVGSSSAGKAKDASASPPPADAQEAADQVATAAEDEADKIKGGRDG